MQLGVLYFYLLNLSTLTRWLRNIKVTEKTRKRTWKFHRKQCSFLLSLSMTLTLSLSHSPPFLFSPELNNFLVFSQYRVIFSFSLFFFFLCTQIKKQVVPALVMIYLWTNQYSTGFQDHMSQCLLNRCKGTDPKKKCESSREINNSLSKPQWQVMSLKNISLWIASL